MQHVTKMGSSLAKIDFDFDISNDPGMTSQVSQNKKKNTCIKCGLELVRKKWNISSIRNSDILKFLISPNWN